MYEFVVANTAGLIAAIKAAVSEDRTPIRIHLDGTRFYIHAPREITERRAAEILRNLRTIPALSLRAQEN